MKRVLYKDLYVGKNITLDNKLYFIIKIKNINNKRGVFEAINRLHRKETIEIHKFSNIEFVIILFKNGARCLYEY